MKLTADSIFRRIQRLCVWLRLKEPSTKGRMASLLWDGELRLTHLLFRLKKPNHGHVYGTILLLLSPVQYELLPQLRWDKPKGLRQNLITFVALKVLKKEGLSVWTWPPETLRRIHEIADETERAIASHTPDWLGPDCEETLSVSERNSGCPA